MKMNRLFSLLFVSVITSTTVCQVTNSSKYEINVGANKLLTNNTDYEPKIGYGISLKRIWFSDKRINLASGILFEKTKYFADFVQCSHYCQYENMTYNIYSFSVPVMVRANTGKKYRLFIETGPAFEIVPLKWGKGTEIINPPLSLSTESEISGDFEHDLIDFGFNIGVGFVFPVKSFRFVLLSTYHNSIKYLITDQQDYLTEYITLKLGISFD